MGEPNTGSSKVPTSVSMCSVTPVSTVRVSPGSSPRLLAEEMGRMMSPSDATWWPSAIPASRSSAEVRLKEPSPPSTVVVTATAVLRFTLVTPSTAAASANSASRSGSPVNLMKTSGDSACS